ncbi:hypothetical protein H7F51_13365 [Novosphingobium flavum]|uniref:Uncharacterized protein n=1 Tax=Novosphingobium flavum TaxID=1778672 RepID=A0A7X1FT60_9SPHN|nr:hypothetical protein [Novosphingobium flavum]MBC2666511.1 hypothetical protein [Novosphingobium flavum]
MLFTVLLAATAPISVDKNLSEMAALYDEVCLRTFPDDKSVARLMAERGAEELSPAEVTVTMVDDPARAWRLAGSKTTVWLEFPPFHACSVRWNSPEIGDLSAYQAIAERYMASNDYHPMEPLEGDRGDIHIRITGQRRDLPGDGAESLMMVVQNISNSARRAAGETGLSLRFVHQIAFPRKD